MRHVLSIDDLTTQEIQDVLSRATSLKSNLKDGIRPQKYCGYVMGLLFEKPSLRTRVSFETLFKQLGGGSLFLGKDVGWGTREPLCDFMPILTSYLDVLVIRAKSHELVQQSIPFSRCPVINGLTDVSHPCQALADILTVVETSDNDQDTLIAYLGDANNVAYSLAKICSKLNIRLNIAAPNNYQFSDEIMQSFNEGHDSPVILQTDQPKAAAESANYIYTDVWTSMGQEAESKQRLVDLADYQVNDAVMSVAASDAKFLHCLPARRGEEVTESVINGPQSVIIDQAENRLHAQKGLVDWLLEINGVQPKAS